MKLRTVFAAAAVIAILFGLGLLLIPQQLSDVYGVELSVGGIYFARLVAAAFLGIGVLSWQVRGAGPSTERQAILLGFFITQTLAVIIGLISQLQAESNALGWSTVIINAFFASAFGYYRFMDS
ncbi:MAG: hypothetical protein R3300_07570 [Candidatus Promineifilaceae bacterium]|nr:hypothetical protein [Candidatus Promineifilaceae bacterium]